MTLIEVTVDEHFQRKFVFDVESGQEATEMALSGEYQHSDSDAWNTTTFRELEDIPAQRRRISEPVVDYDNRKWVDVDEGEFREMEMDDYRRETLSDLEYERKELLNDAREDAMEVPE